jgi:hypothetical protein
VIGPKDLFFAGGIISGTGGVLNEATTAIATAVALLAPGGISVSYGAGAGAMAAVSSLRIHTFYDTSTTAIDPLPLFFQPGRLNTASWRLLSGAEALA